MGAHRADDEVNGALHVVRSPHRDVGLDGTRGCVHVLDDEQLEDEAEGLQLVDAPRDANAVRLAAQSQRRVALGDHEVLEQLGGEGRAGAGVECLEFAANAGDVWPTKEKRRPGEKNNE